KCKFPYFLKVLGQGLAAFWFSEREVCEKSASGFLILEKSGYAAAQNRAGMYQILLRLESFIDVELTAC
ncbi:417_t:CDS:2, partial [Rhizophagus irregularis]